MPGAMLAGRYRIVGLLGRGGMGEVYRADDLKLGQPVALKFLPEGLERDRSRLNRFLDEIRTARQVSHSNVCRVYDLGEANGQQFLSMEYVDGEDLASLLRRIGRLPKDKAVQVARQVCAGLAAAHEQRILHRDLKPANVMIDGRGRVKIMDFGLAGLAERFSGAEIGAGTPAYMAPEQLAGKEVTVRSDIYALGLLLYELFTGKRAFRAATAAELARLHRDSTPTNPSSHVEGFDPLVERVILRCLEKEPGDRPASALAVAAALPGGDPLAAALAAGETPSPEMVADAGTTGGLHPGVAAAFFAFVLLALASLPFLVERMSVLGQVALELPPEALAVEAQRIIEQAGHTVAPVDTAYGFVYDEDYFAHARERPPVDRWSDLAVVRPAPIHYWYRQSPRYLTPVVYSDDGELSVTPDDPPPTVSGMVGVRLDPRGRLLQLDAVPPQVDSSDDSAARATATEPDWSAFFERAGIEPDDLTPARPEWNPLVDCDLRRAWLGSYPGAAAEAGAAEITPVEAAPAARADHPIRIEAGAYRGRVVFFKIVTPWSEPHRMETRPWGPGEKAAAFLGLGLLLVVLVGGLVLARRNLRLGRGDRRGAFRLAACVFLLGTLAWALRAEHEPTFREIGLFFQDLVWTLFFSGSIWMVYIALEPYVRRLWPRGIISWNRLLQGRWRDPLVGRDALIGAAFGLAANGLNFVGAVLPGWVGLPAEEPPQGSLLALDGVRRSISEIMFVNFAVVDTVVYLFLLVLLRVILRRHWAAVAALVLFLGTVRTLGATNVSVEGPVAFAYWGLLILVLARFGIVAFLAARIFMYPAWIYPLTTDLSSWYAGRSVFALLLLLAIAGYGFYVSLAGRPLFADGLLEAEPARRP